MKDNLILEKLASYKSLLLVSIIFLGASYFLANFILAFFLEVIKALEQFSKDPKSVHFSMNVHDFLNYQSAYSAFYIGFYIIAAIGLIKFIYNLRINYKTLNQGQYGTSEFATLKELKKQYKKIPSSKTEYDGEGGVIIAGVQENFKPYYLLIDEAPSHTMVIGITRSGKGETFVFPMIDVQSRAKRKPSLVINDPKGELAAASYDTLKQRGYEVYVFNLIQQHMSMGFDPLKLVIDAWKKGNTSLAQQYANSVAFSLYNDPNAKDPFWNNSAKSLVTAIILALTEDGIAVGKEDKVNMYSVANFLSTLGSDNDDEGNNALDLFFKARKETNPARMMYATSNFAAGNTRASIFSTAMDKLQIFTLEPNAKLTSYNSLDLTDVGFGEKPVAIFMVTPDYDKSNHVLASIFVSQLYRVNAEKATMSPNGKMKRVVHFILDEFGNMPPIEGMESMVTVGAGRGFRFHLIIQAYSQLKSMYGDDADTIIGNCSNQIYILTKDKQTAEQYSSLIGNKTITDIGRSGKLLSTDKSNSESAKERPLLMPDELMQLKEGESVVVRAVKRQDNKKRKIKPKPIFNTGKTTSKFRWEYLSDDFDNSKSIMSLPISSEKYYNLHLEDMVFTAKSENDIFLKMKSVMSKQDFLGLRKKFWDLLFASNHDFEYADEFNNWTCLQFFSYLAFSTEFNNRHFSMLVERYLEQYYDTRFINEWKDIIENKRSEQARLKTNEFVSEIVGDPIPTNENLTDDDNDNEEDIRSRLRKQITTG